MAFESGFEILEHTADVGLRARGETIERCFEQATVALGTIAGFWAPGGGGETVEVDLPYDDIEAGIVDWLNEVLWLHDSRDAVVTSVTVEHVGDGAVRARLDLAPREDEELEGTQVKAITYHQLRVQQSSEGWTAEVFVDV